MQSDSQRFPIAGNTFLQQDGRGPAPLRDNPSAEGKLAETQAAKIPRLPPRWLPADTRLKFLAGIFRQTRPVRRSARRGDLLDLKGRRRSSWAPRATLRSRLRSIRRPRSSRRVVWLGATLVAARHRSISAVTARRHADVPLGCDQACWATLISLRSAGDHRWLSDPRAAPGDHPRRLISGANETSADALVRSRASARHGWVPSVADGAQRSSHFESRGSIAGAVKGAPPMAYTRCDTTHLARRGA